MPVAMASHPQDSGDAETKQTNAPKPGPGPPPDGGLVAWLQVVGGFFLNFNTWYRFSLPAILPCLALLMIGN